MININIHNEKVIITERTALKDLVAVDCYPIQIDGGIALLIPEIPKGLDKKDLYVAGIITADKLGDMNTVTDTVTFESLTWDKEWEAWYGVFIEDGDFDKYDCEAGIKIFFGGC